MKISIESFNSKTSVFSLYPREVLNTFLYEMRVHDSNLFLTPIY